MSDVNTDFTRATLRDARGIAKEKQGKIPHLRAHKLGGFTNAWYEVYGPKGMLWQGTAYNAYEAKANCIMKLIEQAEKA
jgi:hypothetical protein